MASREPTDSAPPAIAPAGSRTLRLAHRGDHRRAPENTIEAFVAAMHIAGCDGVELDVRASADGAAVVLHDETLARVFERPGRAADLSVAELAAIGVPTLAVALASLPPTAFVDVELKESVVDAAVEAVTAIRGDLPRGIVLSSFDPHVLEEAGRRVPAWPRWLNWVELGPETMARALDLGCSGVSIEWHALDERAIARAHQAGLEVAAWTVRRRVTAARLTRLEVDALCVEGAALDPGA